LSDGSNTYLYGLNRIAQQNIVGRQYYLGDTLGSVRQLVNPVGAVTLARSYEPFGKLLSTAGNPLTRYGYTGEWTDPTNLVYLRARYYDPATGRFISKDPVRGLASLPQTLNPYTYAVNNPIRYTDPSGEYIETLIDIGFIGFDIYTLINHWNTGCGNLSSDLLALGLDVVGAVLPFATGLGMVARIGSKTDDAIKLAAKMENVREAGLAGELLAEITKNTTHIDSLTSIVSYRIPDVLDRSAGLIQEVKNVADKLAYTGQLKDFALFAQKEGFRFDLIVRKGTKFTGPLQKAIDEGLINVIRRLP
jgi:RHS repeat-associated protein